MQAKLQAFGLWDESYRENDGFMLKYTIRYFYEYREHSVIETFSI